MADVISEAGRDVSSAVGRSGPIPIVALDVPDGKRAMDLAEVLGPGCDFYKVGSQLFTAEGPSIVERLVGSRREVFLDLKFHDIPNTVGGAVRSAVRMGARLVTVHASGGEAMVRAAVEAVKGAQENNGGAGGASRCGILAVTVLTSLSAEEVETAWGRSAGVRVLDEVLRLAEVASRAGAEGVVCGGHEAAAVRERFGDRLSILVPGVRSSGGAVQDQARVVTPSEAASAGATYVVLGRAVTGVADPGGALRRIAAELSGAWGGEGGEDEGGGTAGSN